MVVKFLKFIFMKKLTYLIFSFIIFSTSIFAQSVDNIEAVLQNGKVIINYDLKSKSSKPVKVDVYCSVDGYDKALKQVEGDIGKVYAGIEKKIFWTYAGEFKNTRLNEINFKIIASSGSVSGQNISNWVTIDANKSNTVSLNNGGNSNNNNNTNDNSDKNQNNNNNSDVAVDNEPPVITITSPDVSRGFVPVVQQSQITVTGTVTDVSGVFEVKINNEEAFVDANGNFSKNILLAYGENTFTVKATDVKNNYITKTFEIERTSDIPVVDNNTDNNNQNNDNSNDQQVNNNGKFYAIIIGVSNYPDPFIPSLNNEPTNDAQELANILTTNYTFDQANVKLLKDATYRQIVRTFDDLSKEITEDDNLLIFYAGHGYYDDNQELGYWLPSDAEVDYTDAWLYNSVLVDNIKKINSKHTLLIADACFSGSIFQTRALPQGAGLAYQKKYELKSRNAITSGVLKTVPNKSVFFKYLSQTLGNNQKPYLSASELFQAIEIPVGSNSPNSPQFGDIQYVGHEGGDFIFIKKGN